MRRSMVAVVVALGLTLSVQTAASPAVAIDDASGPSPATDPGAAEALATAQRILSAPAPPAARSSASRPSATLALRDLFVALPRLDALDRQQAQGLLARPTDGAGDPLGDGYTVPAERTCNRRFCIHWVDRTRDAPPSRSWVDTNLALMTGVWRKEVRRLGYRKPISDGHRGGNARFDVYLKDLGPMGVYGYCTPERRAAGSKWLASGYCVLDDDFARAQYDAPPKDSLRVTAAHEFFHAVQFAYDYGEDGWLMESTATWMEERVADGVNDNRQYLPYGQLGRPAQSLDVYRQQGFNQYGNWPFFEYLGTRFGSGVVREIWTRAGAYPGSGHEYSTAAVSSVLADHGGFAKVFRAYAASNTAPARAYREGGRWPSAPASQVWRLSESAPRESATLRINHLASRTVVVEPGASLRSARWKLRVVVDGPGGRTDPAAYLVVRRKDAPAYRAVPLDSHGRGRVSVGFAAREVRSVTVVLVNASTRFSCWRRTSWSCQGRPRDNREAFTVTTLAHRTGT